MGVTFTGCLEGEIGSVMIMIWYGARMNKDVTRGSRNEILQRLKKKYYSTNNYHNHLHHTTSTTFLHLWHFFLVHCPNGRLGE